MKKKILIVEDEFIIAEDLRVTIEDFGYEVIKILPSSDEVIDFLKQNSLKLDLVLLDIKIEGSMNGIELAKIIKDNYKISVVFCTAYHGAEVDKLKQKLGIDIVRKPFLEFILKDTIDAALKKI